MIYEKLCHIDIIVSGFAVTVTVRGPKRYSNGPDFLASQVVKSPEKKFCFFILTFEWEPLTKV